MVFAVVDKAGSTVMENEEEVCKVLIEEIGHEAEQEKKKKARATDKPQILRGESHVPLTSRVMHGLSEN